ncbi:MAG: hypothetical protein B6242_12280 [Anaerolineaceae bacterium 4572_78]|nr:MAG: hypothetical protein B6242_12280 [Anaerolineaceae bacterium 4572_78]
MFKNLMQEISEIFQPLYDNIDGWKSFKDIGHFDESTIEELKDVWELIPDGYKKVIYKEIKRLLDLAQKEILAPEVLRAFVTALAASLL